MAVLNVHERVIDAPANTVGELLQTLGQPDDRLWPAENWPAMKLDRPVGIGAMGGHGPVRYGIAGYAESRWVRFEFSAPAGFHGFHEYTVHPLDEQRAVLRHTLTMKTRGVSRISWPLAFRWFHDAVLEDSLDLAEKACTGGVRRPARWGLYVRLLRRITPS